MKVLFFNYEYPPIGGGASTATEALLLSWVRDPSVEVHLITSGAGNVSERLELGGSVFVHRLPIGKDPRQLHSQSTRDILVYTWHAWCFSRRLVREQAALSAPFDVSLAFFTVPCGFLAYLVERYFGIPFVVSLRGADVPGFSEKYRMLYVFLKPLIRFLWRHAQAVIPNSRGIRVLAAETSPDQAMAIIENGVDTEVFHPVPDPARLEVETSPVVFVSTSRLTPRKGIASLVEAFGQAVHMTQVLLELWLIGEGEQRDMLEKRVKELGLASAVRFVGRVEREKLSTYYQKAQVFVLPSQNEGMSNSALEALASGLPLVVSRTGGMQELVTDGENGFLIDPTETEEFARVLVKVAEAPEERRAFGLVSRERALTRGWDAVARQFRLVLEEACVKNMQEKEI